MKRLTVIAIATCSLAALVFVSTAFARGSAPKHMISKPYAMRLIRQVVRKQTNHQHWKFATPKNLLLKYFTSPMRGYMFTARATPKKVKADGVPSKVFANIWVYDGQWLSKKRGSRRGAKRVKLTFPYVAKKK